MLHYQKIEIPLSLKVILAASHQWCRERMLKDVFPECGVFCPDPSKAWSVPIFLFLSANWCTNVVGFFLEAEQAAPCRVMTRPVQLGELFGEIQLISTMCA